MPGVHLILIGPRRVCTVLQHVVIMGANHLRIYVSLRQLPLKSADVVDHGHRGDITIENSAGNMV